MAHVRLGRTLVECLPYEKMIQKYDREGTLFYLDPPYWGCENDYGKDIFSRADFEHIRDLLRAVKGKFIMSINDVSEIRELFADFNIKTVDTKYQIGNTKVVKELLITNY